MLDMSDGFGYVAQGDKGLFGVRSLSPISYAKGISTPDFCNKLTEPFGTVSKVTGAAMFHGRVSTNTVSFNNTHPINRDNWSMIHNGVVTNHGEKYAMTTSNDSEHVLYNMITGSIDRVASSLTGYYAYGAIDPLGQLHVVRDGIAKLFYAYSTKIDSPIFATTEELIEKIGDKLGETLIGQAVKDNTYLVYNGKALLKHVSFKSRGWDDHSKSLSGKSLGVQFPSGYPNSQAYWQGDDLSPPDHPKDDEINYEDISQDYLDEYQFFDDSYQFSFGFKELTCEEFFKLEFSSQMECVVKRHDGTVLEPYNDESEEYDNVTTLRKVN